MRQFYLYIITLFLIVSCADDDSLQPNPFVVAFDETSGSMAESSQIQLSFSESAESSGYVKIQLENMSTETVQTIYGVDYQINPVPENNVIILPFAVGDNGVSFDFETLLTNFTEEDQDKGVIFTITEIDYREGASIQGYSTHTISFDVKTGGTEEPQIGGPNEQNQAYFDLSTGEYRLVQRDSWDLGFYSGDDFRVILNSSIYMATKSLDSNDIDAVTEADIPSSYFSEVAIGTFDPDNEEFIDNPNGDITDTAIQEIVVEPNDNQVYLVNLGYEVGTITPNNGSVAVAGDARGWKKIRILRQDDGYLLQYADLDSTTHQEIFVPKTPEYNFNHFSFDSNELVQVQPPKTDWDICFTVFTNVVTDNEGNSAGSYGFSDFVVNNILADAKAFMLTTEDGETYEDYELDETEALTMLSDDQRAIGSNWRSVFTGVYDDRFFVLNDTEGNWYKIRFLALTNEDGERGHPKFEYQLL